MATGAIAILTSQARDRISSIHLFGPGRIFETVFRDKPIRAEDVDLRDLNASGSGPRDAPHL